MENNKTAGRPFKMVPWLAELKKVLADTDTTFLTDEDLWFLVNERLPEEQQISDRTFENWKADKFIPNDELAGEFRKCITKARIAQKIALGKELLEGDPKKHKSLAWTLERKFDEQFNLKKKSESITKEEKSFTLNISAPDNARLERLNDIVNTDFKIIQTIPLASKDSINPDNELENDLF